MPMGTLHQWVQRHEQEQGGVAPARDETPQETIRRLQARVAQLEEERDILKKAATFFAKESE